MASTSSPTQPGFSSAPPPLPDEMTRPTDLDANFERLPRKGSSSVAPPLPDEMTRPTDRDANFERLPRKGVIHPLPDRKTRPPDLRSKRPSLGKRAVRGLTRFLIVFCIGVAATLGWQAYGDKAREMIADSSPRLAWLAPHAAPVAQTAPAASSPDAQQLKDMSLGLAAVQQSVDQLAAQFAAGQQQMASDIAKLQRGISVPQPWPAAAPASKPVPPTQTPQVR
jgi:hypothetical protein